MSSPMLSVIDMRMRWLSDQPSHDSSISIIIVPPTAATAWPDRMTPLPSWYRARCGASSPAHAPDWAANAAAKTNARPI